MREKEFKLSLEGLSCANCANKIEAKVNNLNEVHQSVVNFAFGTLSVELNDNETKSEVISKITQIVKELEPDVLVYEVGLDSSIKKPDLAKKNKSFKISNSGLEKQNIKISKKCPDSCNCSGLEKCNLEKKEEKQQNKFVKNTPLIIGTIIFVVAMLIGEEKTFAKNLFYISYALVGYKVILSAARNFTKGQVFDENFLMSVATIGALSINAYPEAVAVMIFYEIGEIFQDYAVNRSRKSISSLVNIRADYANVIINAVEKRVSPEEVSIGDIILIKPGEKVPLDGVIVSGISSLNTSALTGETLPRDVQEDDEILSGSININGAIKVRVTKSFGESTVSKILELVQNAGNKKAKTEKFITKFARYYTPIVVFLAIALAVIPSFVIPGTDFNTWLYRALIFLVVSCPCALVISIPLGLFAGIGGASKEGILIKGGNYLEALNNVETVVFDKTGTLTKGTFKVISVNNIGISKEEMLKVAALGESFSNHPIARSIVEAYGGEIDKELVSDYEEVSGNGIKAKIKGKDVIIGNYKLMNQNNLKCLNASEAATIVHVAIDGTNKGYIVISDEIKDDSKAAIKNLKALGIKNVVMLTGDNIKTANKVAEELGVDEVYSELLPTDKVLKLEELLEQKSKKGKVLFVGDGINDAPVLARADIGVAMGGIGSDAAIEASDIVLMRDEPSALGKAIKIGRKTNKILWQNIIFSLGIKVAVLILSALGYANMWEGVFADVGVTLIAVLNSMRALKH